MDENQKEVSELLEELYTYFAVVVALRDDDELGVEPDVEEDFRLRIAAILNT